MDSWPRSFVRVYMLTSELASLGGVSVAQSVHQCAGNGLGVGPARLMPA
jgi:hypothetical protein